MPKLNRPSTTEVVGPLRIERTTMDKIRAIADRQELTRTYVINKLLRESTKTLDRPAL
jgi:hypothetical protein